MSRIAHMTLAPVNPSPEELREAFRKEYGETPRLFRAPGRVNLIGEHTDYNDGFVTPAAIDFSVWLAITPREDRRLRIRSLNFGDSVEVDLAAAHPARHHWSDYVFGVALTLEREGYSLKGANILLQGDVPIGSGLSSSAAIGVASGFALLQVSSLAVDRVQLAQVCRLTENEYVGAHVGIMDPFISCCGHEGSALMLDCRSLSYRLLPLSSDAELVICNTMVKHQHAGGEYNKRRAECEEAVRLLSGLLPQVRALRDVTPEQLARYADKLPDVIYRRCRHVVHENRRVTEAAAALERGDLEHFGELMRASHQSLRDDYEVSCRELDQMVDIAERQPGVYGSRMTGGGFGGCTINIVEKAQVVSFTKTVAAEYAAATGLKPQMFVSSAAEGASEVVA
jgi:galactokinase